MVNKRCVHGLCKSDSRYPERLEGGFKFLPFPKPKTQLEKCKRWIKMCGRPHDQFNINRITKDTYICTKHFNDISGPTKAFPDPSPADPYTPIFKTQTPVRKSPLKRRRLVMDSPDSNLSQVQTVIDEEKESEEVPFKSAACQTDHTWTDPMDMISMAAENQSLKQDLAKSTLETIDLARLISESENKKVDQEDGQAFSVNDILDNASLIKYYTGFSKAAFLAVYNFLVTDDQTIPLKYTGKGNLKQVKEMKLIDQLFLTLCKLRNNFDLLDLGHRFAVSKQTASVIFNSWVQYMYLRFGEISTWPHRDIIRDHMPDEYKKDFPTTFAILDCTEIKIQKPSSLKAQSQTYSDYKSSNTLKGLVGIDPRGSVIFTSMLFSGSISDKELFVQSGLKDQLKSLVDSGFMKEGDGIMADKGFNIEEGVKEVGLQLNIPVFAVSGQQMSASGVALTRKIAKHRVHVERAIRRIKSFKILSNRIHVSLMTSVNQIWCVCSVLTNFMPFCIKDK